MLCASWSIDAFAATGGEGWMVGVDATTIITSFLIGALLARLAYLLPKQSALVSELEALRQARRAQESDAPIPVNPAEPRYSPESTPPDTGAPRDAGVELSPVQTFPADGSEVEDGDPCPTADALLYEGLRWLSLELGHDLEITFSDLRQKLHSEGTFSDPQDDSSPRLLAEALLPLIRRGERVASQLMSFVGEPKDAQPADLHPAHHAETRIDSHRSPRPWRLESLVTECLKTCGFANAKHNIDQTLPPMTVGRPQTAFALQCILFACRQLKTPEVTLSIEARFVKATGESTDKAIPRNQDLEDSRVTLRNTCHYVQISISSPSAVLDKKSQSALFYPNPKTSETTPVGLGFAAAKEILRRQRGSFAVSSQPSQGTRFTLALPLSESASLKESLPMVSSREHPLRQPAPKTSSTPRATTPKKVNGSKTSEDDQRKDRILVMDDEQSILALLSAALRRLGFDPVTTTHGEQALNEALDAEKDGRPFKLAILDLTIPGGMGGVETADNLNELLPDMILVASSGYAQNPALVDFQSFGFDEVLVKPYRIPDLSKLLDRLLAKS